jgi:hypothetical protein
VGAPGSTAEPVFPGAETLEELTEEFERYRRALAEPVLAFESIEAAQGFRRTRRCT